MAARNSYAFQILKCLREADRSLRLGDILEYLNRQEDDLFGSFVRWGPPREDQLAEYLQSLAEIGVVRAETGHEGERLWTLAASPFDGGNGLNRDREGGGRGEGGGGDGGGDGPGGNTPDGEGGGGLSEVLAHPVLFCLTEVDQDQLLLAALGLLPDGADGNDGEAV